MPKISEELLNSYHGTSYFVFPAFSSMSQRITLRIGETSCELDKLLAIFGASRWAFLTAHNPCSTHFKPAENNRRHSRLLSTLAEYNYSILQGKSVADAADWPDEESVLVLNIDLKDALEIATRFEQYGFLFGKPGHPVELILC